MNKNFYLLIELYSYANPRDLKWATDICRPDYDTYWSTRRVETFRGSFMRGNILHWIKTGIILCPNPTHSPLS
jgi:hypothetical protein